MTQTSEDVSLLETGQLPSWFKQELPDMEKIRAMKQKFRASGLHTVCESALCPNMGKCWGEGVATFMILGDICTRACRFCAISAGYPQAVDPNEPIEVARSVQALALKYVVVTSVARDDLKDEGAGHFVQTIKAIRALNPETKVEVLIPDFSNRYESIEQIVAVKPEVVSHNIETIRRLSPDIRPQADYDRSLEVLTNFKRLDSSIFTKSSFMVGLGERDDEIVELMSDLVETGCDILTIGQYLAPTQLKRHVRVARYVKPEQFDIYKQKGLELGFKHVMSAPLVRSSFIAERGYRDCLEKLC